MLGTWRWLAMGAAVFSHIATPAAANTPLLDLHDRTADFQMTGGGDSGSGVRGEADLRLGLAGVTTKISGTIHTDSRQSTEKNGSWSGGGVSFDSRWRGKGTALKLHASQRFQQSIRDGAAPGTLYSSHIEQQNDKRSARAVARVEVLDSVALQLGAETENTMTGQSQELADGTPSISRVETNTAREFAKATWSPLPIVDLEAGTALASTSMILDGGTGGDTAWRASEPRVAMTLQPWNGTEFTLAADRKTRPLSAENLAAYAGATGRPADADLRPDSASEMVIGVKQALGSAFSLKASYTTAQLDSTTVLMPAESGQTPASITGGRQQTFHAALSLSLGFLGLPTTRLTSKATWRRSRIVDPITGHARRMSGEAPHDASVRLSQRLAHEHLTWGIEGRLGSGTTYYQASQQTILQQSGSFGAFVQYDPGPFSLRLNIDDIAGNVSQTDIHYMGTRASGIIAHETHGNSTKTVIGLSLTKSLDG